MLARARHLRLTRTGFGDHRAAEALSCDPNALEVDYVFTDGFRCHAKLGCDFANRDAPALNESLRNLPPSGIGKHRLVHSFSVADLAHVGLA